MLLDWKIKAGIVLIALAGLFFWYKHEVSMAVQKAEYDTRIEMQRVYEKRIDILENDSKTTQKELEDKISTQRKEKDAQIKIANTKYNNLVSSLSNRPERPSSQSDISRNTNDGKSAEGTTGLQLYRSDAEFLAWFSGQTSRLQTELNFCYKQYDDVRKTLNDFRSK